MKNIKKTEIALVIVTIAVIVVNAIAVYNLFTERIPMNWSLFTISFAALTIAFCDIDKKKKAAKKALEAAEAGEAEVK